MKYLLIILAVFLITLSTAYSQSGYKNGKIEAIDRISIGAGFGEQIPIGKYPRLKETNMIGNLVIQYEFNEGLYAVMNISLEERNTGSGIVSYVSSGLRYSLLNYRNTLYPYFETELGLYFVNYPNVHPDEYTNDFNDVLDNQLFGYNIGTGMDLRLSPLVTLDINFKFHSFNVDNKRNFFTYLTILKFNL
jgi:hypothetical protein